MRARKLAARIMIVAAGLLLAQGLYASPGVIDTYRVSITSAGFGQLAVSALPATVAPTDQIVIAYGGDWTTLPAAADGSFAAGIPGRAGDQLTFIIQDAQGRYGPPVFLTALALTIKNPYVATGHWHIGQAHMHSTWSDGKQGTPLLERAYYDAGYDFVISTDHRGQAGDWITYDYAGLAPDPDNSSTGKDLLWIRGSELGTEDVHMGAWGHASRISIFDLFAGIQPAIDAVRARGGIVAINHPEKSIPPYAWDWHTEILPTRRYSMVEAFNENGNVELQHGDHIVDAIDLADEFQQVWWIGSDDCHDIYDPVQFNRYAIVVQTASPEPVTSEILGAADAGRMYVRETAGGPEIVGISVTGNDIRLNLAEDSDGYRVTWRRRGNEIARQDDFVTAQSTYRVTGGEGYVRAEIERLRDGLHAYTQPLFVGNSVDLSVDASSPALVDNDASTVWDAGAETGQFTLDAGEIRQLNVIRMDWDKASGRTFNYLVESSSTGAFGGEQTEIVRGTYANLASTTVDFFDTYARYLRVTVLGRASGEPGNARVREAEIFNASPTVTRLFVDNESGDDENSGLLGNAWRSFAAARDRLRPRDTLHLIETGTPYGYLELLARHNGKHPGAVIRITGDPFSQTTVDPAGLDWGVRILGGRFVEVSGLDIQGARRANVFIEGVEGVKLSNSSLHGGAARGLWGRGTFEASHNLIYGNGTEGAFIYSSGTNARLFHNVVYGNGGAGISIQNIGSITAEIRNNVVAKNSGPAFNRSSNSTVVDSHNCSDGNYVGTWAKTGSVQGDVLLENPAAGRFGLQLGSPCMDAGIDLGDVLDLAGNPYFDQPGVPNVGSPGQNSRRFADIGAVENTTCNDCSGGVCH